MGLRSPRACSAKSSPTASPPRSRPAAAQLAAAAAAAVKQPAFHPAPALLRSGLRPEEAGAENLKPGRMFRAAPSSGTDGKARLRALVSLYGIIPAMLPSQCFLYARFCRNGGREGNLPQRKSRVPAQKCAVEKSGISDARIPFLDYLTTNKVSSERPKPPPIWLAR